ncbi:MAG TPA: hypothetical protein VGK06_06565 [Methanosarcina sp.]
MKKLKLSEEFIESIVSRILLIVDIIFDSIVVGFLILSFCLIDKLVIFLGYDNSLVIKIVHFGHDPIIVLSIIMPAIIRLFNKDSYLPHNSKYKVEIDNNPDNITDNRTNNNRTNNNRINNNRTNNNRINNNRTNNNRTNNNRTPGIQSENILIEPNILSKNVLRKSELQSIGPLAESDESEI